MVGAIGGGAVTPEVVIVFGVIVALLLALAGATRHLPIVMPSASDTAAGPMGDAAARVASMSGFLHYMTAVIALFVPLAAALYLVATATLDAGTAAHPTSAFSGCTTVSVSSDDLARVVAMSEDLLSTPLPPSAVPSPRLPYRSSVWCEQFGAKTAVADLSLTVPVGSFYGLVGPNGAGKTTTLSMATGLLHPTRGARSCTGLMCGAGP